MKVIKILIAFSIFFLANSIIWPQVYRLTNNLNQDRNPRIIEDLDDRIWCFWENGSQQDYQILASYFENGQWSSAQIVTDYSNYYYNVDIDRKSGTIWLFVTYYSDSVKIYSGQVSGFSYVGTYINNSYYNLSGTTFNVVDSSNIWMDLVEDSENFLIHFDGLQFSVYQTQFQPPSFCLLIKRPKSSILRNNNKIYYLRNGWFHCIGGGIDGFFDYLCSIDLADTQFVENNIALYLYSEESTLGMDADSYIYFFNIDYDDSSTHNSLSYINLNSDTLYKKIINLNFFPQTATKYDSVCVVGWTNDSTISYKAINDTLFYKTNSISNNEIFDANYFNGLQIQKVQGNNVWLVFSGWLDGQYEIFAAKEEFSTEIDSNYIVSVRNNDVQNTAPKTFKLFQNYPNPFNPVTTIKYNVPIAGQVSLIIYDILGRKIEDLVNKEQKAGTYEIQWNALKLSSGLYLYQLRSNNYLETKKMILLK